MADATEELNGGQIALLLSSLAQGLIDSAVNSRVDHLGGWNKVVVKQGFLCRRDTAVEGMQRAIDSLYAPMPLAVKLLGKNTVKLVEQKGPDSIYDLAAVCVDEVERITTAFVQGEFESITYSDGWRDALDEVERLMFDRKMTRQGAIELLRKARPEPRDLRKSVAGDEEAA